MNYRLPFQDWDIDLDRHRALKLGFVNPCEEYLPSLFDDKQKLLIIASPVWVVIQAADDFQFIIKKEVYQRLVDVSLFLSDFFHFRFYNRSIPRTLHFTGLDPYVMSVCCKYLQWKYKSGQERPGFITNPRLFHQVMDVAKTMGIEVT